MVKRRYSQKTLKFFKVYLPDRSSQRLKIPRAFIKYLKGVIPFNSILTTSSKGSWRIYVKEFDDRIVFDEGWPAFVKDHSLQLGDFLVFSYDGDSTFNVTVFGQNHCIKDAAIALETDQMTQHLHGSMQIQENNGALEMPRNFDLGNPFFESVLHPTYARSVYMRIPDDFRKRYMKKFTRTAMLKCANNKSWQINLTCHSDKVMFGVGWGQFVEDNNLKEGDTCRFELIQTDGYIFSVSIQSAEAKSEKTKGGTKIMSGWPRVQLANKEVGAFQESSKFISKYPFFQTVLSEAYTRRASMHIPEHFWKRNMNMKKQVRKATLKYSNRLWPVMVKFRGRNHYICGGWSIFAKDINLQVGNKCCFELIDRENLVFKVSVTPSS